MSLGFAVVATPLSAKAYVGAGLGVANTDTKH